MIHLDCISRLAGFDRDRSASGKCSAARLLGAFMLVAPAPAFADSVTEPWDFPTVGSVQTGVEACTQTGNLCAGGVGSGNPFKVGSKISSSVSADPPIYFRLSGEKAAKAELSFDLSDKTLHLDAFAHLLTDGTRDYNKPQASANIIIHELIKPVLFYDDASTTYKLYMKLPTIHGSVDGGGLESYASSFQYFVELGGTTILQRIESFASATGYKDQSYTLNDPYVLVKSNQIIDLDIKADADAFAYFFPTKFFADHSTFAEANYSHTIDWGGMELLTQSGQPVEDWTLESASGVDWRTPSLTTSAPEPSVICMLAVGLMVLAARRGFPFGASSGPGSRRFLGRYDTATIGVLMTLPRA